MRKLIPLLTLTCFITVSLMSCDITGEESFDFEPGDSLAIIGSAEITLPEGGSSIQASYYSRGFTISKEYAWSLSGGEGARRDSVYRQGEFMDVTFTETGTYTITVDDGEYQGSLDVTVNSVPSD